MTTPEKAPAPSPVADVDLRHTARSRDLQERVREFMDEHVYPAERVFHEEVERDRWRPSPVPGEAASADSGQAVVIEVYHHPGHDYNVARMIDAVKKSLPPSIAAAGALARASSSPLEASITTIPPG